MSGLSKIWARRIVAGDQVYSDCPEDYRGIKIKEEVNQILLEMVSNGELTQSEYEVLISN